MRIYRTYQCKPSRIGNSHDARFPIIVSNLMYEPVNGVPGICTLIHGTCFILMNQGLMDFHFSLTSVFTSDVLENKNVSVSSQSKKIKFIMKSYHTIRKPIIVNTIRCSLY